MQSRDGNRRRARRRSKLTSPPTQGELEHERRRHSEPVGELRQRGELFGVDLNAHARARLACGLTSGGAVEPL
jgi:hypothetical protein